MFEKIKGLFQRIRMDPVANAVDDSDELLDGYCTLKARELAFAVIKSQVANTISKCELKFYENGKPVKNNYWYKFNIAPNVNQNAVDFWKKLIGKLYDKNEALVVIVDGQFFVADNYVLDKKNVKFPWIFKNVSVDKFTFEKNFSMSEVLYFKLDNEKIKTLLDETTAIFSRLLNSAENGYITANGRKFILHLDTIAKNNEDGKKDFENLMNVQFKKFFGSSNSVLVLNRGMQLEELEPQKLDTRDIRKIIDDAMEITAMAFGFPKSLLTGNVENTKQAIEQLLTFVIEPIFTMIQTEINSKLFIEGYLKEEKECCKFDSKAIKHIDILEAAAAIEKLISSGCFNVNDVRKICGEAPIPEKWANRYFMTKNFSTIEDLVNQIDSEKKKGEEKNESKNKTENSGT